MFYDRNNLWLGLGLGLVVPFVGYAVFLMLNDSLGGSLRVRTMGLLAICLNIFLMQFYRKRRYEDTMRGIFIATGGYIVLWFIYFASQLFG